MFSLDLALVYRITGDWWVLSFVDPRNRWDVNTVIYFAPTFELWSSTQNVWPWSAS